MTEIDKHDAKISITEASPDKYMLEEMQMKIEAGLLGRVFGTEKNAPTNIAGTIVCALILAGVFSFFQEKVPPLDFWNIIVPIITAFFGYMFGKKSS